MKKILKLIITLTFLTSSFFTLLLKAEGDSESSSYGVSDPFAVGPEGRTEADLREYGKPNQMTNILPGRPVAAKDKYGNRLIFTPDGKLTLKVSPDGKMEFSLKTQSKETDNDGKLTTKTAIAQGTSLNEIKNEKGEIKGYQELGLGGKVIKEYDYQKNLTKTYQYDKYGKTLECVVNELSLTKTICDKNGNPKYDIDFEGHTVAKYTNDEYGKLVSKEDVWGNVTYFNKNGNMTYTEGPTGYLKMQYNYVMDDIGRNVLLTSFDPISKETVYFENGNPQYVKNENGTTLQEYKWDGSKLLYVYNNGTQETTYFNINGKEIYTTFEDNIVKEWLYFNGRLVGYYSANEKSATLFQYERTDVVMHLDVPPTAELIQKWYDEGYIEKLKQDFNIKTIQGGDGILNKEDGSISFPNGEINFLPK